MRARAVLTAIFASALLVACSAGEEPPQQPTETSPETPEHEAAAEPEPEPGADSEADDVEEVEAALEVTAPPSELPPRAVQGVEERRALEAEYVRLVHANDAADTSHISDEDLLAAAMRFCDHVDENAGLSFRLNHTFVSVYEYPDSVTDTDTAAMVVSYTAALLICPEYGDAFLAEIDTWD